MAPAADTGGGMASPASFRISKTCWKHSSPVNTQGWCIATRAAHRVGVQAADLDLGGGIIGIGVHILTLCTHHANLRTTSQNDFYLKA